MVMMHYQLMHLNYLKYAALFRFLTLIKKKPLGEETDG
jgi:hypothetical protein